MAAKPKLTLEEWAKVRAAWEADPREGYAWIIEELSLPVSAPGVRKVSIRDQWKKKSKKPSNKDAAKLSNPKKTAEESSKLIPKRKVSKVSKENHAKVSETIDIETINDEPETDNEAGSGSAGRPTCYREKYNKQAYRLCLLGATDDELAEFFEVDVSTINRWKIDHSGFYESLKKGKMSADSRVAERLYERAMGYSHPEIHVSNHQGEITQTELIKHYPPDTAAAFIWLKNRQPGKWRDKIEVGINVKLDRETLIQIEQTFMEKMTQARERQKALLVERGILIEHGQD